MMVFVEVFYLPDQSQPTAFLFTKIVEKIFMPNNVENIKIFM